MAVQAQYAETIMDGAYHQQKITRTSGNKDGNNKYSQTNKTVILKLNNK